MSWILRTENLTLEWVGGKLRGDKLLEFEIWRDVQLPLPATATGPDVEPTAPGELETYVAAYWFLRSEDDPIVFMNTPPNFSDLWVPEDGKPLAGYVY